MLLDYGNTLTDSRKFSRDKIEQENKKARIIFNTLEKLNYNFINIGESELLLGKKFLAKLSEESALKFISANVVDKKSKKPAFTPYKIIESSGLRFLITGVISSEANPELKKITEEDGLKIQDPSDTLTTIFKNQKDKYDFTVVLSAMKNSAAQALTENVEGIDLIFGSKGYRYTEGTSKKENAVIVGNISRGKEVSLITLKVSSKEASFINLSGTDNLKRGIVNFNRRIGNIKKSRYDRSKKRQLNARLIEKRDKLQKQLDDIKNKSKSKSSNFVLTKAYRLDATVSDDKDTRASLEKFYNAGAGSSKATDKKR